MKAKGHYMTKYLIELETLEEFRSNEAGNLKKPATADEIKLVERVIRHVACTFHHVDDTEIWNEIEKALGHLTDLREKRT